jgi:acyl-CoA synthetase (AMP-forming)/AMP-acid ligase II
MNLSDLSVANSLRVGEALFALGLALPVFAGGNTFAALEPEAAVHVLAVVTILVCWQILRSTEANKTPVPRPIFIANACLVVLASWWIATLVARPSGPRAFLEAQGILCAILLFATLSQRRLEPYATARFVRGLLLGTMGTVAFGQYQYWVAFPRTIPLAHAAGIPAHATLALAHTRDDDVVEPALGEDDPHVLFFTSGSTGRPKGVVLSHRANWLRSFQGVFRDEPERSVCMFPLFHMAAFTLALAAWQTRGEIAFVRSPTPEALLAAVERRRANRLYCIPLVWARILAAELGRYDLASLRELDTGTSATPPELIHAMKQRFPWTRTRIYYGSTEAGSVATLPDAEVLAKPGSVGRAAPGVELRLSAAGEICARSPFLMDGYFDDAEATAAALRDGWYHTGDLGALDADGCLSIVGRMKDVIRTGGESVAPAEVEAALAGCEGVREVAVIGLADPEWGELVCAVVVPEPGAALTLEGLRAHCEGRIAGFKRPRRLVELAALPRTPATGQIQRALLIERITSGS